MNNHAPAGFRPGRKRPSRAEHESLIGSARLGPCHGAPFGSAVGSVGVAVCLTTAQSPRGRIDARPYLDHPGAAGMLARAIVGVPGAQGSARFRRRSRTGKITERARRKARSARQGFAFGSAVGSVGSAAASIQRFGSAVGRRSARLGCRRSARLGCRRSARLKKAWPSCPPLP